MDHNFLVSYEAETETISNPILCNQTLASSTNVPSSPTYISSSPQRTPPVQTRTPHNPAAEQDDQARDEPRNEPAKPLFGVEALMDSIKQAIQQRHDTFEHSDEMSSRRSSFSSTSPSNSPTTLDIPQQSQPIPDSSTNKPSLPHKPARGAKSDSAPPLSVPKAPPLALKAPKPTPKASRAATKKDSDRSQLLQSIEQGLKLRKTVTNDRSAPRV